MRIPTEMMGGIIDAFKCASENNCFYGTPQKSPHDDTVDALQYSFASMEHRKVQRAKESNTIELTDYRVIPDNEPERSETKKEEHQKCK